MTQTVIVGAGPAGLTTAYELARLGRAAVVYESESAVGGLSRTVEVHGYRFDIGGHRFLTKAASVEAIWHEILGDDLLIRERLSRIQYQGRFFDYPLRPLDALTGLGVAESLHVIASYLLARLSPAAQERSFEQWVVRRFGRRLYEIFFKTYTEKVWGIPGSEINADWASQRIRDLNLGKAIAAAFMPGGRDRRELMTLAERFLYPRHGPGMMWERCRDLVAREGIDTVTGMRVTRIEHVAGRVVAVEVEDAARGRRERVEAEHVVSTMAVRDLVDTLSPAPPDEVVSAARRLRHRDFLTVALFVDREHVFPDNWVYVHSPEVKLGRIQNFKNWSPEMVPDPTRTALGLEYFVHEGDELWCASDEALIEIGCAESAAIGLVDPADVFDGAVVRAAKAYPIYDAGYQDALATVRRYLATIPNLQTIGRNGQHRYNNQDHSMLTGIYAARRIAGDPVDPWAVNTDPDYQESSTGDARAVPRRLDGGGG